MPVDTRIKKINKFFGSWSLIGLALILISLVYFTRSDAFVFISDFLSIFQGDLSSRTILPTQVVSFVFFSCLVMLFTSIVFSKIFFNPKTARENQDGSTEAIFESGPHFFYGLITFEELFARLLFLGLFAYLLHANNAVLIALILIGNGIWAFAHYYNYKAGQRKLVYIIPVFVLGLLLSYVFVRYGFWMTLLVHLFYDFIAISSYKNQITFGRNITSSIFWLIVTGATAMILVSGPTAIPNLQSWVSGDISALNDLSFIQVGLLFFFINSVLNLLGSLLCLDDIVDFDKEISDRGLPIVILEVAFKTVIALAVILGIYTLLGLFHMGPLVKVLLTSFVIMLMNRPRTGSSIAKLWLIDSVIVFVTVYLVATLPFTSALVIVFLTTMFEFLPYLTRPIQKKLNQRLIFDSTFIISTKGSEKENS